MIFLYIIGGLLALISLLLLVPVWITARYEDELSLRVRWLFIKYDYPAQDKPKSRATQFFGALWQKIKKGCASCKKAVKKLWRKIFPKKVQKPVQQTAPKEKKNVWKSLFEERGFSGAVGFLLNIAKATGGGFGDVFKGMTVEKLDVQAYISADDAAQTAMTYGEYCAVIYPAVSLLLCSVRKHKSRVDIQPDFLSQESRCTIDARFRTAPMRVLCAAVKALYKIIASEVAEKVRQAKNEAAAQMSVSGR